MFSESAFAVSDLVLNGFLRVVTHPRVFAPPTPTDTARPPVMGEAAERRQFVVSG